MWELTYHHNKSTRVMKEESAKMDETQFLNLNKKVNNKYPLLKYEELPEYMKDNEYILNYYRAGWPLNHAFISLFMCHNETLNVWTHLIGFVAFLVLTIANLTDLYQVADFLQVSKWAFSSNHPLNNTRQMMSSYIDASPPLIEATRWPLFVYLGGSMFCFVSSSICHLFSCHSHHLNCRLTQLDYTGISVMIIASFFPPVYYIFQCTPVWQYVYLTIITILGVFAIMVLLSPTRMKGKFRFMRTLIFVSMGLFGVIPSIHATIVNWNVPQRNTTLGFESAMGFSYLVGAMFYVSRVPEKWKPGWFDLVGHSHQIFHVFVVMGALAHYVSVLILYEYRRRISCD
ncbi:heptahelical transmembrane protein 1-like [Bidens hawaiensis]|uniref:heptahelical transmembrane protein 1-like n=1 Tax=Bidens hawaiensis TaxID=980011 RepID=UPI00404985BA